MKAIVNGKLILKDRIVEGKALLYTDVIEGIVDADKVPADAEIIDAAGKYVAPGFIDTDMNSDVSKCDKEAFEAETPLGRIGTPEEVAACKESYTGEYLREKLG